MQHDKQLFVCHLDIYFMGLLLSAADVAVASSLGFYYGAASHRGDAASINPSVSADHLRPLHFLRGMMNFEPGPHFIATLQEAGLRTRVFREDLPLKESALRPWHVATARAIEHYAAHPEEVGENPVFAGHSAGGFTVYTLGAIASNAPLEGLRKALPDLDVSAGELTILRDALQGASFFAVATPFNGILIRPLARRLNSRVLDPLIPGFFTGLLAESLETFYATVGRRPADVMNGLVYSDGAPINSDGGLLSHAMNTYVQGALRLFGALQADRGPTDVIVPLRAASVAGVPAQLVHMNHLHLVETEAGARALLAVMQPSV